MILLSKTRLKSLAILSLLGLALPVLAARDRLTVDLAQPGKASARLYGLFFEEINHAGDGGLYAELIQNRSFEETLPPEDMTLKGEWCVAPASPNYSFGTNRNWRVRWKFESPWPGWSLEGPGSGKTRLSLQTNAPVHPANVNYLRMMVPADAGGAVMLLNGGYWGVAVREGRTYDVSLYARVTSGDFKGALRVGVLDAEGEVLGSAVINGVTSPAWQQFKTSFAVRGTHTKAAFFLQPLSPGTLELDVISLFPRDTFKKRRNGLRPDLAQKLADLKPAFLRFPGGCVVEGATFGNRYRWKETLGKIEERPGHWSLWGYRNTDGLGYHEFLQLCEDLGCDALFVSNAGLSCEYRNGDYLPEERLGEVVQDTLDALQYALGGPDTRWGAERARAGHPAPFPLKYLEIGNENHGPIYARYYARIAAAVRKQWPAVKLIYNDQPPASIPRGAIDLLTEHFYREPGWFFANAGRFDTFSRAYPLYIGEFACNRAVGSGNMLAALSEAAFMLGMERNSDLVTMASYAPLLFNVNRLDWPVNLIGFDNANSFGRSSYYAQKMMVENLPALSLPCELTDANPAQTPAFAGLVGLGAWETDVEFRNFSIEQYGKVIYRNDFQENPRWQSMGGRWAATNGVFRAEGKTSRRKALLTSAQLESGVIKVQARKISGAEGFQVFFAGLDQEAMALNIGGWAQQYHGFERTQGGRGLGRVGQDTKAGTLETNRWYDVRVQVNQTNVIGFLDNKRVAQFTRPPGQRFFAGAGLDAARKELVLKLVNATPGARTVALDLKNGRLSGGGKMISLAGGWDQENTIKDPRKLVPKEAALTLVPESPEIQLKPYSLTVVRLPLQ
jgi:alpha-L-arabinofuranosidase